MCISFQYADSPLAAQTCFLLLFLWVFLGLVLFPLGILKKFWLVFFSDINSSLLNMVRCSQRHSGLHPEFIHSLNFFSVSLYLWKPVSSSISAVWRVPTGRGKKFIPCTPPSLILLCRKTLSDNQVSKQDS